MCVGDDFTVHDTGFCCVIDLCTYLGRYGRLRCYDERYKGI